MDKPSEQRISIRINGKDKLSLTEQELNQEIAAAKEMDDTEDSHTFMMDEFLDELPSYKIIDLEEQRNKRGKKTSVIDQQLFYEKPILSKINKRRPHLFHRKYRTNTSLKKIIIALVLALIIGTGLGYIVLALFTDIAGDNEKSPATEVGQAIGKPNSQVTNTLIGEHALVPGSETTTDEITPNVAPSNVIANIEPMKFEVVQGGAFSSIESANQYASKLKNSGAAAVIVPNTEPVLMYIGIGTNRSESVVISDFYQEKNQEVYLKMIETISLDASRINNQVAEYTATGQALYQSLISLSTDALQFKTIDNKQWKQAETTFSDWNQLKPAKLPASLIEFSDSITASYQAIGKYQTTNDQKQLWNSQQFLLEGLLSYQKWTKEAAGQ